LPPEQAGSGELTTYRSLKTGHFFDHPAKTGTSRIVRSSIWCTVQNAEDETHGKFVFTKPHSWFAESMLWRVDRSLQNVEGWLDLGSCMMGDFVARPEVGQTGTEEGPVSILI
jgi:hypothetical protein